jgi:hypothetical protein
VALLAQIESIAQTLDRFRRIRAAATVVRDAGAGRERRLAARVCVSETDDGLVYSEAGAWGDGRRTTNLLRWSIVDDAIVLEHLRNGPDAPVALVRFSARTPTRRQCDQPHLCAEDVYVASVRIARSSIALRWRITGPAKRLSLLTLYS